MDYKVSKGIRSWAEDDRPREKLLAKGRSMLTDAELIAILFGSGSRNETAVDLAKRVLSSQENNLDALGKMSVRELMEFKGIGEAKAIGLIAALELGRRRKASSPQKRTRISGSQDVFDEVYPVMADLPHEEFWILLLNRANEVVGRNNLSKGGVSGTVVDAKMIFKMAIEKLASAIILAHNHPSGNLRPSQADISLTNKIRDAGNILDIPVLDHLIIGNGAYYSFKDEGIL
jgi:DNA repair protein RadC